VALAQSYVRLACANWVMKFVAPALEFARITLSLYLLSKKKRKMRVIEVESTLESWSIDTIDTPALLLYFYLFFSTAKSFYVA